MHLPYPSRKDSNAARFAPSRGPLGNSKYPLPPRLLRIRLKGWIVIGVVVLSLFFILTTLRGGSSSGGRGSSRGSSSGTYTEHVPSGTPPLVVVTVLKGSGYSNGYLETIKENRRLYSEKHGYETFFPSASDYDLDGAPDSWAKVVAVRHALTKFPDATYIWFVDQDAFIMDPRAAIHGPALMEPRTLEAAMIKDHPVVPPDSIIKTFAHLKGGDVDLVVTQDREGLSVGSFVVRNGEWAHFFLETWFDPLYRSYNFQKAEAHALEHIVQWHPTVLSKLALVPQRLINAYSSKDLGEQYSAGDILVRFPSCVKTGADGKPSKDGCEAEARKFEQQWRMAFKEAS